MEVLKQIASIMQPVRIYKVEDWMKIADKLSLEQMLRSDYDPALDSAYSYLRHLLSRFESLTSEVLKKEHFVWDVIALPHPDDYADDEGGADSYLKAMDNYKSDCESAQAKLLFEGFEMREIDGNNLYDFGDELSITFDNYDGWRLYLGNRDSVLIDTIFDFLYHLTKYNETAQSKITLNWSESFLQKLIGN